MQRLSRVCVALILGMVPMPARATTILPATLDELASDAVAIFHGRVVGVEGRWEPDRRQIESFVSIEVVEYLKGDLGPVVTVRAAGGEIGRYRSVVVGAPTFGVGDEVILFVGATGPSYPRVLGLNQGVFRVRRAGGPAAMILPPPVVSLPGATRLVRGDRQRRPVALEEFVTQVRGLVARHRL